MIDIIYEDEFIIAVNKPSGVLVIPTPKNETNTLTDKINLEFQKRGLSVKAHPCHRLDRETSGIILYAKGKKMQQRMMELFHEHSIKKIYIAIASGNITKKAGEIKLYIEGKPAITNYRVLKSTTDYSIVEVEPLTGRTNQIRIHFKHIGHPLLGETKFAFRKDFKIKFKRVALHAHELEFIHPETKELIKLVAPIPEDINKYI
jgi:23S rRNA pseudouridine1911/1915/1917 synthase